MKKNSIDDKFKRYVKDGKLSISSIEDIMLEDFETYKEQQISHLEELLLKEVNEKDLINKKKIYGLIKELRLKIKEKKL